MNKINSTWGQILRYMNLIYYNYQFQNKNFIIFFTIIFIIIKQVNLQMYM